jgi:hypothetical protein
MPSAPAAGSGPYSTNSAVALLCAVASASLEAAERANERMSARRTPSESMAGPSKKP